MFKFIARRPIKRTTRYLKFGYVETELETYVCPRCDSRLNAGPNFVPGYCCICGQKLAFGGIVFAGERELGYGRREYEPVKD